MKKMHVQSLQLLHPFLMQPLPALVLVVVRVVVVKRVTQINQVTLTLTLTVSLVHSRYFVHISNFKKKIKLILLL